MQDLQFMLQKVTSVSDHAPYIFMLAFPECVPSWRCQSWMAECICLAVTARLPLCSLLHVALSPFAHTPVAFLTPSTHSFVPQHDIFIVLKKKKKKHWKALKKWCLKKSICCFVEMGFWWTGAHLCTSDKMFTTVADLFFCPFEVSIYSTAVNQEAVFSL